MTVRARILAKFPSQVLAGTGIRIDKSGLAYTFSMDVSNIAVTSPISGDYFVSTHSDGTTFFRTEYSALVASVGVALNVANVVIGPASATDNAIARYDLTTGKLIQNSSAILSDAGVLTTSSFVGPLTGNADTATLATTATTSTNVTVANEAADTTCFPLFATAATGNLPPKSNAGLTYNSNTSNLGSTILSGSNLILAAVSPSYGEGKLNYDTAQKCLTFFNDRSNCSLQIGRENWARCANNTGSTILNGKVVYINGTSGGLFQIALAQGNSSIVALGIATEDITTASNGEVCTYGIVNGVDTSAFTAGATLYVDATTPGTLTSTRPAAPNFAIRVGTVGVSNASTGTIFVNSPTTNLGFGTANQIQGMNSGATGQEYKTLAVGTAGTDFAVTNAANSITFNLPDAGAAARGVITTGVQTIAGAKTFTSAVTGNSFIPTSSTIPTNGLYLPAANTMGWAINSAAEIQLTATAFSPATDDGNALGTTSLEWSDLFLATGGVINWNNGNVTLTHSAAALAFAGGAVTIGSAGVPLIINSTNSNASKIGLQDAGVTRGFFGAANGINFSVANSDGTNAMLFTNVTTAVNYIAPASGATGTSPSISMLGTDTNLDFRTVAKGTGVLINAGSNTNTHATAVNLSIDTNGAIRKFSSSIRYKTEIEDMALEDRGKILELRPIWYRSKSEADNPDWSFNSFIAEEVAEINPRWALWDYKPEDKNEYGVLINKDAKLVPDGLSFPAILVGLVAHVQDQEKRIKQLEGSIK